jgi:hypothetical protein
VDLCARDRHRGAAVPDGWRAVRGCPSVCLPPCQAVSGGRSVRFRSAELSGMTGVRGRGHHGRVDLDAFVAFHAPVVKFSGQDFALLVPCGSRHTDHRKVVRLHERAHR